MFVFSPLSLRYPPLDLSPRLDLFTVFENLSKSLILRTFNLQRENSLKIRQIHLKFVKFT